MESNQFFQFGKPSDSEKEAETKEVKAIKKTCWRYTRSCWICNERKGNFIFKLCFRIPQELLCLGILNIPHQTLAFFFFFSFGRHPWHTEVLRLGVESELQLPAYTTTTLDPSFICDLHHSSWQCWILNPLSDSFPLCPDGNSKDFYDHYLKLHLPSPPAPSTHYPRPVTYSSLTFIIL